MGARHEALQCKSSFPLSRSHTATAVGALRVGCISMIWLMMLHLSPQHIRQIAAVGMSRQV